MIAPLKRHLSDQMLFSVMLMAQADTPPIGWLQVHASIGSPAHMRAFDAPLLAAGNAALVSADPGTVGRTTPTRVIIDARPDESGGK